MHEKMAGGCLFRWQNPAGDQGVGRI